MSPKFKDYYDVLGVARTAGADDIRKAYRKLARKYHPDINKQADAEARFKEIGEAYEVLNDPEKRRRYDALGAHYRAGQDFAPPPGWAPGGSEFETGAQSGGDFSDFFEMLFGGGFQSSRRGRHPFEGFGRRRGEDHTAELAITLEDAFHGVRKPFRLQTAGPDARGRLRPETRQYTVRIPPGTGEGARIRLAGAGGAGAGGGPSGDLYLTVRIAPHPVFRLKGADLEVTVPVTPWEAALGARIPVPTLSGDAALTLPAGTQGGQRFRLRGKGMAGRQQGDLIVAIQVALPRRLSDREKSLFQELARVSAFNPRQP